ncbi:MAG: DivIVA domain-containing protein [candidate division KSB1 bacterium]|nr:DivIVA domain-containing protein [candidate division KSB1 bacterium]MDQ7064672.1 DivIVA domain-containing protein [candidate division KSB1 bacterium]
MKLTPLDIKKQEFKKSLRGYDPVEVDAFLEMVADEFEALIKEKNQLADEVLKLRTQLQDYQQVEKTLKETLVNAQENITASRQTSQREADMILREAELRAEKIIENARMKLERLKNDIMLIKAQKESFARRLRHLLESQIELIHVLEMDDVGYDDISKKDEKIAQKPGKSEEKREGSFQRRKIDIPFQRSGSPLVRDASNRLARENSEEKSANDETEAKKNDQKKDDKSVPRISDQFIT